MSTQQENISTESNASDDINFLLDKINALISVSGNKSLLASKTVPRSQTETDALKKEGFSDAQLKEIQLGLEEKLPTHIYAQTNYNWMQMHEIRRGLLELLNVALYKDPLFTASQMHEIRLGLVNHLDVSSYARLVLSSGDMRNIRKALLSEAYQKDPTGFGRTVKDIDTGIILRISDDLMSAFITLSPDSRQDLTQEDIIQVLDDHEIVYGIIDEHIQKLADEKPLDQEICIARGKYPIKGKQGWYEFFFENSIEKGHVVPPDGEIDYTDVNFIDKVTPGTVLAKYHPAQKSTEGMTINGIVIVGKAEENLPFLTGTGFELNKTDHTYVATETGYPSFDAATNSLNVWNIFEVHGNVSYFQSVEYDGTIHVFGSVQNMSTIRAMGDIIIDGFVENAHIYSGQNVVIKGGVNGGTVGNVEAGGTIRGKFFENATLKAGGMIEGNYFMNCTIVTDDRLSAKGKKARILGGDITAALGVEAVIIGNYLSDKTIFRIGDTTELENRISRIMQNREKSLSELNQLKIGRQKLIMLLGETAVQKNALYTKTCIAIDIKEKEVDNFDHDLVRLQGVIRRSVDAYIRVFGELQADVVLVVGGIRKRIQKNIKRNIYLTKAILLKGSR